MWCLRGSKSSAKTLFVVMKELVVLNGDKKLSEWVCGPKYRYSSNVKLTIKLLVWHLVLTQRWLMPSCCNPLWRCGLEIYLVLKLLNTNCELGIIILNCFILIYFTWFKGIQLWFYLIQRCYIMILPASKILHYDFTWLEGKLAWCWQWRWCLRTAGCLHYWQIMLVMIKTMTVCWEHNWFRGSVKIATVCVRDLSVMR